MPQFDSGAAEPIGRFSEGLLLRLLHKSPPALDISALPVFTLTCKQGPLTGNIYTVTDPGKALISGKCQDIGRLKGPILRGLAARAPYFHNGSVATLLDAVNFYDQRFNIGLTDQQKSDLERAPNDLNRIEIPESAEI